MNPFKILIDKKISITDDITKSNNIMKEKMVCLTTSIFTFSLFLSFMMDLYNLNPLTAKAKMAGINKIFCNKSKISTNSMPWGNPIIVIQTAMV